MNIDEQTAVAWVENNISSVVGGIVNSDEDVCNMIAESGASGWGLETFEPVTAFSIDRDRCGFVVSVNLAGDLPSNRSCPFHSARAGLCGTLVRYDSPDWQLDNVEVLSLTRNDDCD